MDQKGLRGSSATRIDEKGRLKVPALFRGVIHDQHGPDVFVTSVTGESVLIYPMPVWLEIEQKLSKMASTHPSRLKYLDRVNYYGQEGELDSQGRVVIPRTCERAHRLSAKYECSDASITSKSGTLSALPRSCNSAPGLMRTRCGCRSRGSERVGRWSFVVPRW